MTNLYLDGILEQEGFYFIKPLLGKPGQPGFIDCIGYLKYEKGVMVLKRPSFNDLEIDPSITPESPWPL